MKLATIQDGSLTAGPTFPQDRYMLELYKLKGMAVDRVFFHSGHRGGAMRISRSLRVVRSFMTGGWITGTRAI